MGGHKRIDRVGVAERLSDAASGVKLRQLARDIERIVGPGTRGASYGAVRNLVEGNTYNPRIDILTAAAQVLGVRPEWLIWNEGERTEEEEAGRRAALAGMPSPDDEILAAFSDEFPEVLRTPYARGDVAFAWHHCFDLMKGRPGTPQDKRVAVAREVARAVRAPLDALGINPAALSPWRLAMFTSLVSRAIAATRVGPHALEEPRAAAAAQPKPQRKTQPKKKTRRTSKGA